MKPKKTRQAEWDRPARGYDRLVGDEGSEYQKELILPGVYRLLDPSPDDLILDSGCGQGVFCRFLSRKKVASVGIDLSSQMIRIARSKQSNSALESYHVMNAAHLTLPDLPRFDGVVSILAVQNMESCEKVAAESSRAVKRNGKLVWVLIHPCFRIPRQSSWEYDESKKLQYRRVDLYMSETAIPIQMHPGKEPGITTHTYHRPVSGFINALCRNGWAITGMEEWPSHKKSQPGGRAKAENRARNEIPLFMAITARNERG